MEIEETLRLLNSWWISGKIREEIEKGLRELESGKGRTYKNWNAFAFMILVPSSCTSCCFIIPPNTFCMLRFLTLSTAMRTATNALHKTSLLLLTYFLFS